MSTTGEGRSPTWPPMTCTTLACSAAREPTTGIPPFGRLVEQVMTAEPYASAQRVFWVVDNGSSHRGQAVGRPLEGEWPNLRLVHLPVHASWLNQVEIVFSIVQRKVVTPNDFFDINAIASLLAAFEDRYNAIPPSRSTGGSPRRPQPACSSRIVLPTLLPCPRQPPPRPQPKPGTHAVGSPRYKPQAQSKASSGLPPMLPVGKCAFQ